MLQYNFERVFKAKGIDKPFTFLRNAGFSDNFATKVKNSRVNRLTLNLLERLCVTLACTPNDFLEWAPDKNQSLPNQHPLNELKRTGKIIDLTKTINSLPMDKLEALEKYLNGE